MIPLRSAVLLLALLMCGVSAASTEDKRPDQRPDPRLDHAITLAVAYDSLEQLCARLRQFSADAAPGAPGYPVEITCDPAIKEYKVVIRVREQPLREVMRQVALLFDLDWEQGPQEHPRYHLVQSAARAQRAAQMRQRCFAEREARARKRLKDIVRAINASPDQLYDLARRAPAAVANALYDERYQAYYGLDDAAVEALLDGAELRFPLAALPPEVRDRIKASVMHTFRRSAEWDEATGIPTRSEQDFLWDQGWITYRRLGDRLPPSISARLDLPAASPEVRPLSNYQLIPTLTSVPLWWAIARALVNAEDRNLFDNEDYQRLRRLETDYGISVVEQAQKELTDIVPPWARPERRREKPAPSGQYFPLGKELRFSRCSPLSLLLLVAERLDFNLVADCYWTRPDDYARTVAGHDPESRYLPSYPSVRDASGAYCVDASPEYTLERICEQSGYHWARDGDFFRVRNLLWFVDDPEEVPKSVLDEWMRRTDNERRPTFEDYLYLAANLTQRQAENIYNTHYFDGSQIQFLDNARCVGWPPAYDALQLWLRLPSALREKARRDGVDVNAELPKHLLPLVEQMLRSDKSRGNRPLLELLSPEQLASLRLYAGYGEQELPIDDTGGREGIHQHYFNIELRSGAAPGGKEAAGERRVFCAAFSLHRTQDPDKVGKIAEPYRHLYQPTRQVPAP